jgi:hypothetical protein
VDPAERARTVSSYRASPSPVTESIPPALRLGLVLDEDAIGELFSSGRLDLGLLVETYELLRTEESRRIFLSTVESYSGTITGDADRDAVPESEIDYVRGEPRLFTYDPDQDGIPEWRISFSHGMPSVASVGVSSDQSAAGRGLPARPTADTDRQTAEVAWERYPYVSSAAVAEWKFGFPPVAFPFAPVQLRPLVPGAAMILPSVDTVAPRLTERSLYSFASWLERPGSIAAGSVERIELFKGAPVRAFETLDGKVLSDTSYRNGYPVLRRMDLNYDGRIDTVERFKNSSFDSDSVETDFDGDGVFEKDTIN